MSPEVASGAAVEAEEKMEVKAASAAWRGEGVVRGGEGRQHEG